MNNLIQNNHVIAFILLDDKKFNDFSLQLKKDWNIDITVVSHNNKNTFNIEAIDFEYELAPFNVPDNEAEILMNYNDIDNATREKILSHKSFLSIKVNSENTNVIAAIPEFTANALVPSSKIVIVFSSSSLVGLIHLA